jgi:pSer/pThr/pTyr-binding forkhead associated (FHA) protein
MSSKTAADLVGKRYIIQRTPYTIGRQGNSLNVSDTSVSRAHVRIDFDVTRKMYTITDLGSRNGTRLQRDGNDPQVLVANKAVVLTPNTLVKIGPDLSFKFS